MFNGDEMETPMVHVANLNAAVTDSDLYDFSLVDGREAIWAEVCRHHRTGQSLGMGYICYNNHEDAAHVIDTLDGTNLNGIPVHLTPSTFTFNEITVDLSVSAHARDMDTRLRKSLQKFGTIRSVRLYTDDDCNRYGYVIFDRLQAAAKAATALKNKEFAKMDYGGKFLVDPQHPSTLVDLMTLSDPSQHQPSVGINVRVDNLNFFVSDQYLREVFSAYGNISFCKVTRKPDLTNGSGRVTFTTRDGAMQAIAAMDGKSIHSSPVNVYLEGVEKRSSLKVDGLEDGHDDKKPRVDAMESGTA